MDEGKSPDLPCSISRLKRQHMYILTEMMENVNFCLLQTENKKPQTSNCLLQRKWKPEVCFSFVVKR